MNFLNALRYYFGYITGILSRNTTIMPIFQFRKLRYKNVRSFAQNSKVGGTGLGV